MSANRSSPNVHSGERLESRHRLLVHNQAIPSLAQPTSGQTQPLQPMAHFLRAKFGSLAPHFHKTVDLDSYFPDVNVLPFLAAKCQCRFDDYRFGRV